jgi:hypothetical protein
LELGVRKLSKQGRSHHLVARLLVFAIAVKHFSHTD